MSNRLRNDFGESEFVRIFILKKKNKTEWISDLIQLTTDQKKSENWFFVYTQLRYYKKNKTKDRF